MLLTVSPAPFNSQATDLNFRESLSYLFSVVVAVVGVIAKCDLFID